MMTGHAVTDSYIRFDNISGQNSPVTRGERLPGAHLPLMKQKKEITLVGNRCAEPHKLAESHYSKITVIKGCQSITIQKVFVGTSYDATKDNGWCSIYHPISKMNTSRKIFPPSIGGGAGGGP